MSSPGSSRPSDQRFDPALPINQRRDEIVNALSGHQVIVVCGETGSGKTTQLPQICLAAGRADGGRMIAHTQPRRLAARAVASRIAQEVGSTLGGVVGVKVRFTDRTSRSTRIKLMTDGLLLAEAAADPLLSAYDTIIIDEAHERSLNIDVLLGLLRGALAQRDELKLIVTSATIDPKRFSAFFERPGRPVPVIEVSGRMYPVEVRYHEPTGPARGPEGADSDQVDPVLVRDAVEELLRPSLPRGDVLVFLPGEREIRLCAEALARSVSGRSGGIDAEVLPLYARLSNEEQDRIFRPGARRRVVLATNVAETSLTVPGIRYVVDAGLARISRYDPRSKVTRLPIEPIARASANQRSGRCGRVSEGVCIRLYTKASFDARPLFTDPEINRANLASVVLRLRSLGLDGPERFPFIDPPDAGAVRDAYETLFELGAISAPSAAAEITEIGRQMASLPLEPRVVRMLLAAKGEGCVDDLLVLAAALSVQDPRERPLARAEDADRAQSVFRDEHSDFLTLLNLWEAYTDAARQGAPMFDWCRRHFVNPQRIREWVDTWNQLGELSDELGLLDSDAGPTSAPTRPRAEGVHRALLTGLIANVCARDEASGGRAYRGFRSNDIAIFPGSVLFRASPRWIMAAELVQTTRLFARTCARIDLAWVSELAGHMLTREVSDAHFDRESGEASAWERVTLAGVVVVPRRRVALAPVDHVRARELLLRDGLGAGLLEGEWGFVAHNRDVIERARAVEARLRRRGVVADADALATWFAQRLPDRVVDRATLSAWLSAEGDARLRLSLGDALRADALAAADPALFPESIELPGGAACTLTYAWEPGKESDGVTMDVALLGLEDVPAARLRWGVPGWLSDVVLTLLKALPKGVRALVEAGGPLDALSADIGGVVTFGEGELTTAISEAVAALRDVEIAPDAWALGAIPDYLRPRMRVLDERGQAIGASRDLDELRRRFGARAARARANALRERFQRDGVTAWDFGTLVFDADPASSGETALKPDPQAVPAIVDRGESVSLTLAPTRELADALTWLGVRRLLMLACREEMAHRVQSLAGWDEMRKDHQQLGSADELRDALACLVCERVFMSGQAPIRSKADFDERLQSQWGRLAQGTFEVGEAVARALAARGRVAHRLSGGTPRLWAASIADIREHAAYLMPAGCLSIMPWARVRELPRFAEAMRARLFTLREDGSGAETNALQQFAPHWKRLTAWVAQRMSAQRDADADAGGPAVEASEVGDEALDARAKAKAAMPGGSRRRSTPVVNVDAGLWALRPGNLPASVLAYRWALEEHRAAVFVADAAASSKAMTQLRQLDALWAKVSNG
jgi:ATP-dependent helicase HrpA